MIAIFLMTVGTQLKANFLLHSLKWIFYLEEIFLSGELIAKNVVSNLMAQINYRLQFKTSTVR